MSRSPTTFTDTTGFGEGQTPRRAEMSVGARYIVPLQYRRITENRYYEGRDPSQHQQHSLRSRGSSNPLSICIKFDSDKVRFLKIGGDCCDWTGWDALLADNTTRSRKHQFVSFGI
jgi:hypothetical protein